MQVEPSVIITSSKADNEMQKVLNEYSMLFFKLILVTGAQVDKFVDSSVGGRCTVEVLSSVDFSNVCPKPVCIIDLSYNIQSMKPASVACWHYPSCQEWKILIKSMMNKD
jgi:hypothetical protein